MAVAVRPSEKEIKRRQELIAQSKERPLADKEVRELYTTLHKELHYSYLTGEIGSLAFLGIHYALDQLFDAEIRGFNRW